MVREDWNVKHIVVWHQSVVLGGAFLLSVKQTRTV